MPLNRLRGLFKHEAELLKLRREVQTLHIELDQLRQQNASMRTGMRRCVTCDYRLAAKQRQADSNTDTGT